MAYIEPNKEKHQYLIGIDFGHGETSADICKILWDDTYETVSTNPPESIEIFPGNKGTQVESVLLEDKTDPIKIKYHIGKAAVRKYQKLCQRTGSDDNTNYLYQYFKKMPSEMTAKDREIMKAFMMEIYKQIRKQREELNDENHLVYIACPSNTNKWSDNELINYSQIASEAGLPIVKLDDSNIGIIRESRAAFIKARLDPQSKTSIKEGVLLIDFGSSTIDFTYYSTHIDKPIDDGDYENGASQVEKTIFKYIKENYYVVNEVTEKDISAENIITFCIRECKEDFYAYNYEDFDVTIPLNLITLGKRNDIKVSLSNDEINEILGKYISNIRNAFKKFYDDYLNDKPIKLIYLAGGASRMGFIKNIAREVFNYKDSFYNDNNPSLTISHGIALAGRADLRTWAMYNKLINSDEIINANIADPTIDLASKNIAIFILDEIAKVYDNFKTTEKIKTIKALENSIKERLSTLSYNNYINEAYKKTLIDTTNFSIIPNLNELTKEYFPEFTIPFINSNSNFTISIENNHSLAIKKMMEDCTLKITEGVIEGLSKIVWNIVTGALVIIGGVIVNTFKAIKNWLTDSKESYYDIGKGIDEVTIDFNDNDTQLDKEQKKKIIESFNKNRSSYETQMINEIRSKLSNNNEFKSQLNNIGIDDIKTYIKEQIHKARLILN